MIDSSNRETLSESYNELAKLLQEKELRESALLIFANKQVSTYNPLRIELCELLTCDNLIKMKKIGQMILI